METVEKCIKMSIVACGSKEGMHGFSLPRLSTFYDYVIFIMKKVQI